MRRSTAKCIKVFILIFVGAFILLQLISSTGIRSHTSTTDNTKVLPLVLHTNSSSLLSVATKDQPDEEHTRVLPPPPMEPPSKEENKEEVDEEDSSSKSKKPGSSLSGERIHGLPNVSSHDGPGQKLHLGSSKEVDRINISKILQRIKEVNEEQSVRNEDIFGPVDNVTTVIVVQVHNRLQYMRQLIISLSQAKGIDHTLIIFSHDVWDEPINELVNSVDFAKTMQIFYPYSIQTHPHEFPGESPNDCPRNAKKDQAKRLQCNNAYWPDLYGHYREAKFTQTKHHWWWKANRVFDQLKATQSFDGLVVFLEEDHYVSEDFLSVLKLIDQERTRKYPSCDIICLGTYLKSYNYNRDHKTVELTQWVSAKHNMGMAFTRTFWRKIHACSDHFCNFDDYNWDWSLQHVSTHCLKSKMEVMLIKGPRVFHIGECGVHHKKKECESSKVVKKVQDILVKAKAFLNPTEIKVVRTSVKKRKSKVAKGNGGWGDHRDQALCLNMAKQSTFAMSQLVVPTKKPPQSLPPSKEKH